MASFSKGFSYPLESDTDVGGMQFRHQSFRTDWSFLEQRQDICFWQNLTNARPFSMIGRRVDHRTAEAIAGIS